MSNSTKKATIEDLQNLIRELGESQKKTEESLREVHTAQQKTEMAQQKTEMAQQEVAEAQKKTEEALQELSQSLNEQSKNLDKANGNFNNKWGAFMEKLISGDLVSLLKDWGLPVEKITTRKIMYRQDKSEFSEYDLIAYNGEAIVVMEIKTTLTKNKVDKFIKKMKTFKKNEVGFSHKKIIYGGVGFLDTDEESPQYAEEQGLFVIRAPGGQANASTILNNKKTFTPKVF